MSYSDLLLTHASIGRGQDPDWEAASRFIDEFPSKLNENQKILLAETQPDWDESEDGLQEFRDTLRWKLSSIEDIWSGKRDAGDVVTTSIGAMTTLIAGGSEEVGITPENWDVLRDLDLAGVLAAAGFSTSEGRNNQSVSVITYEHRHGIDVLVYSSYEAARHALAEICRREWDDEISRWRSGVKQPTGDEEVIEAYFEEVETESYILEEVPVRIGQTDLTPVA